MSPKPSQTYRPMRFSARFQSDNQSPNLILEDAPRPTRIGYIKGILGEFVGDRKTYGVLNRSEPLDTSETHEKFIALIRDEADPWDYDNQSSRSALVEHLKLCTWLEFYDFVELVGRLLLEVDDDPFASIKTTHFKGYQSKVNALLAEDRIGWSLDETSTLIRQIPESLSKRIKATERQLGDDFEAARVHYQKAQNFIYSYPIDEANCVKEIVSALESVVRVCVPGTTTLGDAIKAFKKDGQHPRYLLEALEKLYVHSNATPTVRHGHPEVGSVSIQEAELALHIGIAYIRYFIAIGRQV